MEGGRGRDEKRGAMRVGWRRWGSQSHSLCLISGRIIWLAGGEMTAAGPRRAAATSLKRHDKLGEFEQPDSGTFAVVN